MASSSSHPPPDTAMASGGDSEIPTADAGTMDTGSVGDESVDGSRFSPVPEDDREDFVFPLLDPWYDNGGNFPYIPNKVSLPPSNWEWMLRGQEATADQVWVPPLSSISDLKIQRGDMQPVPIDFEFPCSAAADWFHWVADEFLDVKFCALLERAGVAEAILLSRSCNMYRDTKMLRQILRRWCTSTHTFFFSWGELTITLEDVENHWLLPVLGDMDPFAVEMSEEETLVEQALMARASTRINAWSVYFAKGIEPAIRRAAFVAYWLCKCLFGDAPYYSMKPLYFRLAVKISFGHRFPLAAMFLGYLYLQLDSICLDEVRGGSCHFYYYLLQYFRTADLPLGTLSELPRDCQSFELSPDDTRSLTYLSAVNPGWLPVWSDKGVEYTHYCPNRVRRQFGLDQSVPGSPSETLPRTPNIAPFLNDHAFDYWSQSVSRMVIPCGGKAWHMHCGDAGVLGLGWLLLWQTMSNKAEGPGFLCPITMHILWRPRLYLPLPKPQFLMPRGRAWALQNGMVHGMGGSLYSTAFPSGWKESVKVVEERLRLDSKRGKGGKKIDSGKGASSPAASKQKPKSAAKTSSKRPKVAMDMSMIPPSELGGRALMAPGTSKKKSAAGTSKSQKKSAVDPPVDPTEDTSPPSQETESSAIQEKSAPPSTKAKSQPRSKSVAVKKAKSKPTQKSAVAPPSSSEEPAAELSGEVGDEGEGSDQAPIVIEEVSGGDDVVDAGVGMQPSPIDWTDSDDAMADEALGVTVSDEAVLVMADEAVQSTTSIMAEEAPDETLVGMADEEPLSDRTRIVHEVIPVVADFNIVIIVGSAAEEDQDIDSVDSEETIADEPQPLQIVPFADQRDEPRTIDPIEFHSNPPFARMTSGLFIGGQVPALEGTSIQDADDGGMADTEVRGVDVVPEDVEAPVLRGEGERCSYLRREPPILILIGTSGNSKGPLVAYGNFWVHQDAVPLLQGLVCEVWRTSLPISSLVPGFGGPMLSLLGSVLADMRRTSFKTLSEPKILSWRSVVQDLIAVGFDLDFMLEHLRKVARKFFGEAIASEMKIVQEQISSLQSTLAVLVSYQGELMSAAAASPEAVEVASPIDGLFD
uniref:Aminotransferase-like plant mobile domain-containing protein n=1 Tax=Fagus sylvatica TaxID=28930 RepID=A0A2N9I6J8_FAGSY